jgi:hypothetical protein
MVERRLEIEEFICDNTQTVQINPMIINFLIDHFRTQVFNGTANSPPINQTMYAAPKISEFDIIILVEQDILQLDVPVHHVPMGEISN